MKCKKCELLDQVFSKGIESNYEYWLYTELFVYLHGGADHCKEIISEYNKTIKPYYKKIRKSISL